MSDLFECVKPGVSSDFSKQHVDQSLVETIQATFFFFFFFLIVLKHT